MTPRFPLAPYKISRDSHVIIAFSRTVYFGRSSADGFVQWHAMNVVARVVGVVGIVVVRFIHPRRLVEERWQFLKQGEKFRSFT